MPHAPVQPTVQASERHNKELQDLGQVITYQKLSYLEIVLSLIAWYKLQLHNTI